MMKVGRNEPCPCGSGKKFKKCCKSLKVLLGTKEEVPKNPNIGKKESMLADLLGDMIDFELSKEDLLNVVRDNELDTEEAKKLMSELSQSSDALEKSLNSWDVEYGLPDLEEEEEESTYSGAEPEEYYEFLEKEYDKAKEEGILDVLSVFDFDEENSDKNLIEAINYYKKAEGIIQEVAPIQFLNRYEQRMVNLSGFRPKLYTMLLQLKFSQALQERTLFLKNSNKYSFS